MATQNEIDAMRRAVALAVRGLGSTSPNPVVGCVVLDAAGNVAGEGWHERAGEPHAEIHALRAAGERARGGTVVVTLEPCNHTGRTGPCARALIEAGVRRVVAAVPDPYAPAAGGAETLRAAGIEVELGVLAAEAERVNEAWLTFVRLGRPFVTWKYGASLDGRIAAADGTSRWITSSESRADAHRLRAESDAVVVGSGTRRADDPHLAVRDAPAARQPLRVVVDTEARTPLDARVLDAAAPTLIAVAEDVDTPPYPCEVVRLPRAERGLDLKALLAALKDRDVVSVLLEGGPTLAGSFLAEDLVDRVVGYVAPVLIGGGGLPALAGPGAPTIGAARRFRLDDVTRIGPDVRIVARPERKES
ncbi:bifunctional diaminohydroxyphosphoribosylaminopyrimidine deaminase/5-amino-6-(5-phosphoribosylamino)uracil reductase RibD [Carbonactinospora thermoautotrophica]|nr:bifunctional diaminohydroxyphosphoribosylaminopyrimidine deaminase/5-amino-6-(5-phosphoribosylamino)uracil reductase RibD [Carbonactinospora thermoautotrophica]MCX9192989.1 bifunctional diaminohydroxyphosphoribosylaminopyrimidine deaminase/5-amino-6-(5-phosphoribosylamino)uracil reductase RibD [Carbonactinospora thermoautotrophica]